MARVIKAIAPIAIAVGISLLAPPIAAGILGAGASAFAVSVTTALVGVGLAIAAGVAMKALGLTPKVGPPSAVAYTPGLASASLMAPFGTRVKVPDGLAAMPARRHGFWSSRYRGVWRFWLNRTIGDCMKGTLPAWKTWLVLDTRGPIEPGDLFEFSLRDEAKAFPEAYQRDRYGQRTEGLTKRFLGLDRARGVVMFECDHPHTIMETGIDNIAFAYRVASFAATEQEARRQLWQARLGRG